MLNLKNFAHFTLKRCLSTTANNVVEHLINRTLIRVSGPEVTNYLQGLITNDIAHLGSGPGSMYTMFLNSAGRVLYDTIMYRHLEENSYLIECDNQIADTLQKHLKLFRVKRKIDITNLGDDLKVYALFNNEKISYVSSDRLSISDGAIVPCLKLHESQPSTILKKYNNILIYRDPRIIHLGLRIIARADVDITSELSGLGITATTTEQNYRLIRYSLGVGEGVEDLPPGDCFPLECNCDYLHGVSFHKGCYIGQELTARVYHTGVIRKRLMPIYFTKAPSKFPDTKIVQDNINLGKLRGIEKDTGLALLRVSKALAVKHIKLGDGIALTAKPSWWPNEASKEKATISKLQ